jgi:hypothetical protein
VPPVAPPLPPPQPRPPEPDTTHPSLSSAYNDAADTSRRPSFNPVTQRGRPLRPAFTERERLAPSDPTEPDTEPPPF